MPFLRFYMWLRARYGPAVAFAVTTLVLWLLVCAVIAALAVAVTQ